VSTARLREEISRLRERVKPTPPARSEEERYRDWQARASIARREATPPSVKIASVKLRWLRRVDKFSDFESAQQLAQDILLGPDGSGCQQPPEERSSVLVRREVFFAIWCGTEGTAHLATQVPPEWASMFRAAEEWRQKMLAVPTEVLARWVLACRPFLQHERDGVDGEIDRITEEHLGPYGISEELLERVAGPDRDVLSPEEVHWLVYAPLADDYCSPWCWLTHEAVREIDQREGGN
jgi:hypothetical protein